VSANALLGAISAGSGGGFSSGGNSDSSRQSQSQAGAVVNFGAKVGNSQGGVDGKTALIIGAALIGGALLLRRR